MKAEFRGHKHILVGDFNYDLIKLEGPGESLFKMFTNEGFHQS